MVDLLLPEIKASAMPRAGIMDKTAIHPVEVSTKEPSGIVDIVMLSRYCPDYSERRAKSLSLIPGARKRGRWEGGRESERAVSCSGSRRRVFF
jgi:hypothetical protein